MERKDALRRIEFLQDLPEEALCAIAAAGRERTLKKGELLFAENQANLGLIVVLTGAVRVYKLDNRGRELTLSVETTGASVAELPLFDGGPYPAQAEAAEETTVFLVARDRFLQMMAQHPTIAEGALRTLARRMRSLVQMVEAQTLHSVRARLSAYLLRASSGQTSFLLTETNADIGSQIGTVRDVVSRALRGLGDAGVIALQGRQVTIPDPARLRHLAIGGTETAWPGRSD